MLHIVAAIKHSLEKPRGYCARRGSIVKSQPKSHRHANPSPRAAPMLLAIACLIAHRRAERRKTVQRKARSRSFSKQMGSQIPGKFEKSTTDQRRRREARNRKVSFTVDLRARDRLARHADRAEEAGGSTPQDADGDVQSTSSRRPARQDRIAGN